MSTQAQDTVRTPPTRWHAVRAGRIIASCDALSWDTADIILGPYARSDARIVTEAEWLRLYSRRALPAPGRTVPEPSRLVASTDLTDRLANDGCFLGYEKHLHHHVNSALLLLYHYGELLTPMQYAVAIGQFFADPELEGALLRALPAAGLRIQITELE